MSIPVLKAKVAMLMHPGTSLKEVSSSLSFCLMSSERVWRSENRLHDFPKTSESGKSHSGLCFFSNWKLSPSATVCDLQLLKLYMLFLHFFECKDSKQGVLWSTDTRVPVVWLVRIQLEYQGSAVILDKMHWARRHKDILSVCVCQRVCLSCATVDGGGTSCADSAVFAGLTYACSWETLRWGQHLLTDRVMWSDREGERVDETSADCHSCLLHVWPSLPVGKCFGAI